MPTLPLHFIAKGAGDAARVPAPPARLTHPPRSADGGQQDTAAPTPSEGATPAQAPRRPPLPPRRDSAPRPPAPPPAGAPRAAPLLHRGQRERPAQQPVPRAVPLPPPIPPASTRRIKSPRREQRRRSTPSAPQGPGPGPPPPILAPHLPSASPSSADVLIAPAPKAGARHCGKHLQEIPSSNSNVSASFSSDWDSSKTSEILSGMGVSVLKKDKLDNENMPRDLLVSSACPPKRQKVNEKEKDFVIVRRPRLLREAESGYCWDTLPDELLLLIFAYLPLNDLLKVSLTCKRWHRLSSLTSTILCRRFDESLWQSLDLTGTNLLPGVIGQLLPVGVTVFRCPRSFIGDPLFKTSKPLRVQHMDLSNCTVSVADLQSILCLCKRLQNLSLEGLVLSDDIVKSVANNPSLTRLNLCGCSGFSVEALECMLNSCAMLDELNLSWCDFTATHVTAAVNHVTSKVTQLNLSGYRQNLQIADVKTLVERCPFLVHLDLSDSVMLKPECFQYFHQLIFLQHLCLSRCYQISPAELLELGEIPMLKTLQVFGIVTDSSLQLLKETLPDIKINCSHFTSIARPTVSSKKSHEIWGFKCRLMLRNTSGAP
ncbi:S-phase kinase-associated protein 2 [Porphyrio hochstetteri]